MAIESSRVRHASIETVPPSAASAASPLQTTRRAAARALAGAGAAVGSALGAASAVAAWTKAVIKPFSDWFYGTALIRFDTSSLRRRIVLANVAGLIVLLVGWLVLAENQDGPIEAKRESLEAQGRLIAAAIVSNAKVDNRDIVLDPEKLATTGPAPVPFRDDGFAALEMTIGPERVAPLLSRMIEGTYNRARVYTRDGSIIVDSQQLDLSSRRLARGPSVGDAPELAPKVKDFSTRLSRFIARTKLDVLKDVASANGKSHPLIKKALSGGSSAAILLNEDSDEIVAVAMPLVRMGAVHGALLLSARPGEIEKLRIRERRRIIPLVIMALLASVIASILLARTVAQPTKELSAAADRVTYNINARSEFVRFGDREDEIGQLSRAFAKMTAALYRRAEASEKFAADVAHELKNPLTAARSTAESLRYAKTDEKRAELVDQINIELKRLNKLITDVSNASRMEAELALKETAPVEVDAVLRGIVSTFEDRSSSSSGPRLQLTVAPEASGAGGVIAGHAGRIGQVFTNLIDNAISFSPQGGTVRIRLIRDRDELDITFEDEGPGVPEEMRDRIFERFYTYRPTAESSRGNNSGLGLAISREIVRAHEGRIWAENRAEGGARFVVRLPMRTRKPARRPSLVSMRRDA
ncbi:MAG: stimulus-sensing domain-containing protein [Hyphomicrobiaceae bacterium]